MAGFVSKLTMLIVLLSVGSVVLARASRSEEELLDEPLVWADVERAFERADRRRDRRAVASPDRSSLGRTGRDPASDRPGTAGSGTAGHDGPTAAAARSTASPWPGRPAGPTGIRTGSSTSRRPSPDHDAP